MATGSTGSALPAEWDEYFHGFLADPDFIASEEMLPPQDVPEPLFPSASLDLESLYELAFLLGAQSERSVQEIAPTPPSSSQDVPASPGFPPQTTTPIDDGTRLCAVCSTSILPPSPIPSPQIATFPPFNWKLIPQKIYGHGRRQWGFRPSQNVSFNTNGSPGMNMGDASRGIFTGLDGRDDPVLQDASNVISYRLLFPGYRSNGTVQISTRNWTKGRGPISRSKLAHQVSKKLERYLDSMARSHSIDGSTPKQWEIGKGFMHLDNMFMVSLESVSKGSFQSVIYVVDPTM